MYIKEASWRIGFSEMLIHKGVLAIRVWQPAAERTALAWGHKRSVSKILILSPSFPYGMNTYLKSDSGLSYFQFLVHFCVICNIKAGQQVKVSQKDCRRAEN